jgi:hypothetical protein
MNLHLRTLDILHRARNIAIEMAEWIKDKDIADEPVITTALGLVVTRFFTTEKNKRYAERSFNEWIETIKSIVYEELQKADDKRNEEQHD